MAEQLVHQQDVEDSYDNRKLSQRHLGILTLSLELLLQFFTLQAKTTIEFFYWEVFYHDS